MSMTPQEYESINQRYSPASKGWKTIPMAWLFGGIICCIGQALSDFYQAFGLEKEIAAASVSVTLVFLAALLTGLGVYDNIAKYGGAGCLVPITGFSNAVASPALDFKSEGLILGLGAKMFVIAGPVIVYGTAASVLYGLILYIFHLY